MIDIWDDPRLDFHAPIVTRYCRVCHGLTFVEDGDGYLIDCPGPCGGTGLTDLPIPKRMESGPRWGRA